MPNTRISIGKQGEHIAAHFLRMKGYEIIAQNFFARVGEIDIVAQNETHRIFVEVKTKTDIAFGHPHEHITPAKINKLHQAARIFNLSHPPSGRLMRIDALEIMLDMRARRATVKHHENIGA